MFYFALIVAKSRASHHLDHYISPTEKTVLLFEEIQNLLKSQESSTLRLIHKKDVVYDQRFALISSLPRNPFFQIVIVDDTIRFTVEKSITKECVIISSVNKSLFSPCLILSRVKRQGLVGSLLCGFNELNVLTESEEVVNALFSKVGLSGLGGSNLVPIAYRASACFPLPSLDPADSGRRSFYGPLCDRSDRPEARSREASRRDRSVPEVESNR